MITIDYFKKSFRQLTGQQQNQAIAFIKSFYFKPLKYSAIEDALYDSNPSFWYSIEHGIYRMDFYSSKNFVCTLSTYIKLDDKQLS